MRAVRADSPVSPSPDSFLIRGGAQAPRRARSRVRLALDPHVSRLRAAEAALIVSELVTNSVVHAGVGDDEAVVLELTTYSDRVRIAVVDSGSELEPHIPADDFGRGGGLGLRVVDDLCSAWGVGHDAEGTTCVWCELPLDRVAA